MAPLAPLVYTPLLDGLHFTRFMWFPPDAEGADEKAAGDRGINTELARRCVVGLGVVLGKRSPWIRRAPFFFSAIIERQTPLDVKRDFKAGFITRVLAGKAKANVRVTTDSSSTPDVILVQIDDPSAYLQATSAKIWTAPLEAVSDEDSIRKQLAPVLKVLEKPRT